MKQWTIVVVGALTVSMVMPMEAMAGRRLPRRFCPPQSYYQGECPAPAPKGAPCTCAFWQWGDYGTYKSYYAVRWGASCSSGMPVNLDGNFTTGLPDPCPTCPSTTCLPSAEALLATGARSAHPHQSGVHLNAGDVGNWNKPLNLAGTTTIDGVKYTAIKLGATGATPAHDGRLVCKFTVGGIDYYAKLHLVRIEATKVSTGATSILEVGVGQEIHTPPVPAAGGPNIISISPPNVVTEGAGSHVAVVTVGSVHYQVVTNRAF
jgi:hypothetical protein